MKELKPGATIGMLGGGQLGRMSLLAGRRLGFQFAVFEPDKLCPARSIADHWFSESFENESALEKFAKICDRVTLEFENVPVAAVNYLAERVEVAPNSGVLSICQNRQKEREFLQNQGIPTANHAIVFSGEQLQQALEMVGTPCVLKSSTCGYDGKGQVKIESQNIDAQQVWHDLGASSAVLESWIDFEAECSVIVARNAKGEMACFPMAENVHRQHILAISAVPNRFPPQVELRGQEIAKHLAEALNLVGLLAVEFFLTKSGQLIVNELAPRPHNSGHYTFDGTRVSQFEQHIRAVANLPLGNPQLIQPVAMMNLLGDLWSEGEPPWHVLLSAPNVRLDLYGKLPKPGRKMGHFCVFANSMQEAWDQAEVLFQKLKPQLKS